MYCLLNNINKQKNICKPNKCLYLQEKININERCN